ncbi:hypothetical protein HanIR_Chr17g0902301 [Helianthus annuus]|nr:hypothetical protein HanIR_Chr17g0902301 [Helianthus annuus]
MTRLFTPKHRPLRRPVFRDPRIHFYKPGPTSSRPTDNDNPITTSPKRDTPTVHRISPFRQSSDRFPFFSYFVVLSNFHIRAIRSV